MPITEHTRRRVLESIPPKGAPLRELSAASGVHISNVRSIFKLLVADGRAFSFRAGTGENSKHEVWLFATENARDEFEERWLDEKARKVKAAQDARIAARRAARSTDDHRSMVAIAAERREARKRAEREQQQIQREADKASLSKEQAKLRRKTAAAGATVFKPGTLAPKPQKSAWADLPAFIPTDLEVVELPCNLRDQFQPEKVLPCFSALRPGQYLDAQPKPWVGAVAA